MKIEMRGKSGFRKLSTRPPHLSADPFRQPHALAVRVSALQVHKAGDRAVLVFNFLDHGKLFVLFKTELI